MPRPGGRRPQAWREGRDPLQNTDYPAPGPEEARCHALQHRGDVPRPRACARGSGAPDPPWPLPNRFTHVLHEPLPGVRHPLRRLLPRRCRRGPSGPGRRTRSWIRASPSPCWTSEGCSSSAAKPGPVTSTCGHTSSGGGSGSAGSSRSSRRGAIPSPGRTQSRSRVAWVKWPAWNTRSGSKAHGTASRSGRGRALNCPATLSRRPA